MGSMLPYIAAPWILWEMDVHGHLNGKILELNGVFSKFYPNIKKNISNTCNRNLQIRCPHSRNGQSKQLMSLRPCGWSPWLRVQLGWSFAIMPVTSLPGWFIEITSKLNIDSLSIHFGSAKKHYRTMPWPNIYTVEAVRDSPLKQFQPSDAFGGEVIMAAPLSQPAAGWKAQKLRHLAVEWDGKALPRHGGPWWSS